MIGPHCPHRDFSRIQLLIPAHIALYIPSAHHNTDRIDSLKTKSDGYTILNSSSGVDISPTIGVMVADHPGHEFKVIEDPIPPHLVDMLVGRLLHKSIVQKDIGANSYFIK